MHFALETLVGPTSEPVSVAEARDWVRQDLAADDVLLGVLIKAARQRAELETQRSLITQTLRLSLDRFPISDDVELITDGWAIYLPRPRLQSVTSIVYVDEDGDTRTLSANNYEVDARSEPGRIAPVDGFTWPDTKAKLNAVTITYQAGYGSAADVPEEIKVAMRLMVASWYDRRGDLVGMQAGEYPIPPAACVLLAGCQVGVYP